MTLCNLWPVSAQQCGAGLSGWSVALVPIRGEKMAASISNRIILHRLALQSKFMHVSRSATAGQWSPMVATEHQRGTPKPSFQLYPSVEEAAQPLLAPYMNRCSALMACTRFCTTVELMSGCWPLLGCCLRSRLFASPPEGLPSGRLGDATKVCRRPQPSNSTPLASRILVLMEPFAPCRSLCAHGDSEWRLRVDAARGRGSGGRHLRC